MDDQKQVPKPFFKRKEVLFTIILLALLGVLLLSSRMTGRPPQIESITPKIGFPQDVMVITGKYFEDERDGGEVVIGGYAPVSSGYLDWSDTQISLRIPEDVNSGMVRVITKNGKSKGLLFTNKQQIPVVLSGPGKPGQPYISSLEPESGSVGTLLTISGMNFGLQRGGSRVLFTWISGDPSREYGEVEDSSLIAASDYDLDYEQWSDREIRVWIPDGASSGQLFVTTDKGRSNAVFVEIESAAGTKLFPEKRTYSVQYSVEVDSVSASGENGLNLWIPLLVQAPEQREIQLVSQEPEPLFDNVSGVKLFAFENIQSNNTYTIFQHFMVDRYSMETKVNIARVPTDYDTSRRMYKKYTSADLVVPAADEEIGKIGSRIVGRERNPYRKAREIYRYVIAQLRVDPEYHERDILKALEERKGNPYLYAVLFCALARSQGVPARPVAGYLIDRDLQAARHYWAEFYIETVGWIPVDPILAEGTIRVNIPPEVDPYAYFFGNLDFNHLALSKGLIELNQLDPQGRTVVRSDIPSLQTIHEEATGELTSYNAYWSDLEVLGIY
jgi:transglutaminase-like putative cysteine protease